MTVLGALRWLAFAGYLALLFLIPTALLWGVPGIALGFLATAAVLTSLRWKGDERIARRLAARPLPPAEAPFLHGAAEEYCRRLNAPRVRLFVVPSPSINFASFGFRRDEPIIALTEGALQRLDRESLTALVGRQILYSRTGEPVLESWLSEFLARLDRLVSPGRAGVALRLRRSAPFRVFLRRVLLYPLTLFPAFVLRASADETRLDLKSLRLTGQARAFAEGLRWMEATAERVPLDVPFSTRHLFLLTPPVRDPLARLLFGVASLSKRIDAVEKLQQVVPLT